MCTFCFNGSAISTTRGLCYVRQTKDSLRLVPILPPRTARGCPLLHIDGRRNEPSLWRLPSIGRQGALEEKAACDLFRQRRDEGRVGRNSEE